MRPILLIKVGGSILEEKQSFKRFLRDTALLRSKYDIVIVHGGGRELTRWLEKIGVKYHFVNGQRYTTPLAAEVAEMVLSGRINKLLAGRLNLEGIKSAGLSLKDGSMVKAKKIKKLGCAGIPVKANPALIKTLLKSGFLPVISTIAQDEKGDTVNINADLVCPCLAGSLKAKKMIYLTDTAGVLDSKGRTIQSIKTGMVNSLIGSGVIHSGMIPKIKAAAEVVMKGVVGEIYILDGRAGVKLGSGTKITR